MEMINMLSLGKNSNLNTENGTQLQKLKNTGEKYSKLMLKESEVVTAILAEGSPEESLFSLI